MRANLIVVSPRDTELGAGRAACCALNLELLLSLVSSSRQTVNKVNLSDGFNVTTFFSCFSNFLNRDTRFSSIFLLKETAIHITSFFSLSNQVE